MLLSRRALLSALLPAVGAAALGVGLAPPSLAEPPPAVLPISELTIETARGRLFRFQVEVAETPDQRARGLQNRTSLPDNAGMLFDFHRPQPVAMWMKDTPLLLDMVFIDDRGVIVAIAESTTPFSRASIEPGVPVRAVLEVHAGTIARLGVQPGDRIRHRVFARLGG